MEMHQSRRILYMRIFFSLPAWLAKTRRSGSTKFQAGVADRGNTTAKGLVALAERIGKTWIG